MDLLFSTLAWLAYWWRYVSSRDRQKEYSCLTYHALTVDVPCQYHPTFQSVSSEKIINVSGPHHTSKTAGPTIHLYNIIYLYPTSNICFNQHCFEAGNVSGFMFLPWTGIKRVWQTGTAITKSSYCIRSITSTPEIKIWEGNYIFKKSQSTDIWFIDVYVLKLSKRLPVNCYIHFCLSC